jgi:hypothetical protein
LVSKGLKFSFYLILEENTFWEAYVWFDEEGMGGISERLIL